MAGWVGVWALGSLLVTLGALDIVFSTPTDTSEGSVGGYLILGGMYFGLGGIAVLTVIQAAALGVGKLVRTSTT